MTPDFGALSAVGLNLQAVLSVDDLDAATRDRLAAAVDLAPWRRLVLIAHAGPQLWRHVQRSAVAGENPIDDFSLDQLDRWWDAQAGDARRLVLYPGEVVVDLQALGRAAGWHHASPLMIGIHPRWGTWFGYRLALLTDAMWAPTRPEAGESPCTACDARPCRAACPAAAVGDERLDLARCLRFRTAAGSPCATTCLARLACPAGASHRYDAGQIRHSYGNSLRAIRRFGLARDLPGGSDGLE